MNVGVEEITFGLYVGKDTPRDLECLKPVDTRWFEDPLAGISAAIGIIGASSYVQIWRRSKHGKRERPVALAILACGDSLKKLRGKPKVLHNFEVLQDLASRHKPTEYADEHVNHRGFVSFRRFNRRYVRPNDRDIWMAFGFGKNGRRRILDRTKTYQRRRKDPLTVVSCNFVVKDGVLTVLFRTEHEYPNQNRIVTSVEKLSYRFAA